MQLNDEEFDNLEYFVKNKEQLIKEHKERIVQLTSQERTEEVTKDEESSSEDEEDTNKQNGVNLEQKVNPLSKNKRRKLKKKRRRKELKEQGLPVSKYLSYLHAHLLLDAK